MRPSPARLFDSARYYLYGLDVAGGRADILDVPREFYNASFLDERALAGKRLGGWHYGLDDLLGAHAQLAVSATSRTQPALRWIFHVGHCGSTLLSRLLDQLPDVLGVRESLPLLALAEASLRRDGASAGDVPKRVDAALALVADLLARGYFPSDRVVVKATSTASLLAPALLAARPADRAILLDLPLPRYLAAYLRDPALRAQARADAVPRLATWHEWARDDSIDLSRLDDAQCIALSWLVETERFARLTRDLATSDRVLRVDGDSMLSRPAEHLAQLARHLELEAVDSDIDAAIASGVLQRYAKQTGRNYDNEARARDLAEAESRHAGEIEAGVRWTEVLSKSLGQPTHHAGHP